MVLVDSLCTLFYKNFFGSKKYMNSLTTRDMDLLIPQPRAIKTKVDVAELLKDLGFIVGFTGSQGYIRLSGPALKGGELGDISTGGELAALTKLTANWKSVIEDALMPLERGG